MNTNVLYILTKKITFPGQKVTQRKGHIHPMMSLRPQREFIIGLWVLKGIFSRYFEGLLLIYYIFLMFLDF
jgi:hypothetical protein